MTNQRFITLLFFTTLAVALAILGLHWLFPSVPFNSPLAWWSLLFFIAFSVGIYVMARRAAVSDNKLIFNNWILLVVFGKMTLSLMVVFVYFETIHPQSKYFVFPFFIVYFFFTIFEAHFMIRLGQVNKK